MRVLDLSLKSELVEVPEKAGHFLAKHYWLVASLFLLLFLACSIERDLRARMWFDELCTLYVAMLASPGAIVRATQDGCDGAPPLYAIVVHYMLPVIRNDALAVRLPATLGFCGMILGVLAFCRQRLPAPYAFAAAFLACYSVLYYATEGRCYGLVLGFSAGALFCWQKATESRPRILPLVFLAACLWLMVATHYLAIFFVVPLGLAELTRAWRSRKLDYAVLAAIVSSAFVLILHYPLIAATRRLLNHFWAPVRVGEIRGFYSEHFSPMLGFCLLALFLVIFLPQAQTSLRGATSQLRRHEWVAIATLSLMPPVVILTAMHTTHAYTPRYILWVVIGFGVLAAALVCVVVRGHVTVGLVLLGLVLGVLAREELAEVRRQPTLRSGEAILRALEKLPQSTEPVVISDGLVFLELSYYARPSLRERIVYSCSPELDLRYYGSDVVALSVLALSRHVKLSLQNYDAILAEYPRFVLATVPRDYLAWYLAGSQNTVVPKDWTIPPMTAREWEWARPVLFDVSISQKTKAPVGSMLK
jgi:hypothetical protein